MLHRHIHKMVEKEVDFGIESLFVETIWQVGIQRSNNGRFNVFNSLRVFVPIHHKKVFLIGRKFLKKVFGGEFHFLLVGLGKVATF